MTAGALSDVALCCDFQREVICGGDPDPQLPLLILGEQ
jgi:hypothetical protein